MWTYRVGRTAAVLALTGGALAGGVRAQTEPVPADSAAGESFRVYDAGGHVASLSAIVERALDSDVLLIGEEHDDDVGHRLELELLERVADRSERPVLLSLEMFERDVQLVLDEYLAGLVTEEHFLLGARPWDHYRSRYRPLVEAARARGLPVVAANAPRRYVNRVTREGPAALQALPERARRYLPPLPYPGPSEQYRAEWDSVMSEAMRAAQGDARGKEGEPPTRETQPAPPQEEAAPPQEEAEAAPPREEAEPVPPREEAEPVPPREEAEPVPPREEAEAVRPREERDPPEPAHYATSPNAIHAQALWDAAMGHAVAVALMSHLGGVVVHVAGSFHVARGTGIPERIEDYRPGTRVVTVVMVKEADVAGWTAAEHADLADFVILTRAGGVQEEPAGR